MSITSFQIEKGEVRADCMPETVGFIQENVNFFHQKLKEVRLGLGESEEITFVSFEDQWTFAYKVEKLELGKISNGKGVIVESAHCVYDEVLSQF